MNRAERRSAEAAKAASEAGRVLQAAGQAKANESPEPTATDDTTQLPAAPKLDNSRQLALEGMYKLRQQNDPEAPVPPAVPEPDQQPSLEGEESEEDIARKAALAAQAKATADKKKADAAAQQKAKEPAKEPAAEAAPTVEPAAEQSAPTTSKQKVDGVEYDVPLAEIEEAGGERAWRINKANENRLAKTNEALAQTRQTQAQLAAWLEAQTPKTPKPTTEQIFAKLAQARFGTDDEFAASLKEAIASSIPNIDQNTIILQATASIKRDQANASFNNEFSDIVANPLVKKLAAQLEMDALSPYIQNGQPNWGALAQLDWNKFYSTIGNQVRSVVGPRQSQPAATPAANAVAGASGNPSQLSDKEARKASIVNLPTAAAARAVAPQEEKPETREEALNRMRRLRGIPTG